jgi:hypothetical protein
MSAMSVIGANLINPSMMPLTLRTGAKSTSDPSAGGNNNNALPSVLSDQVTTADKAGAGICTVLMVAIVVGGAWWLVV